MYECGWIEEWQIFKIWCPWKIAEKIEDTYIDYEEYIRIIRMMNALGFKLLADNFLKSKFYTMRNMTEELVCADKVAEKYDEKTFVKAFVDRIKSENIRRKFFNIDCCTEEKNVVQ